MIWSYLTCNQDQIGHPDIVQWIIYYSLHFLREIDWIFVVYNLEVKINKNKH